MGIGLYLQVYKQWGFANEGSYSHHYDAFVITFPHDVYNVSLTVKLDAGASGVTNARICNHINSNNPVSNTGFYYSGYEGIAATDRQWYCYWMAIGN